MNKTKKITALITAGTVLMSTAAYAANFTDVNSGDYYAAAIESLTDKGILSGYEDGTFRPSANITRAETASVIYRTFLSDTKLSSNAVTGFDDVPSDHWAAPYIKAAVDKGIINGYSDSEFGISDNVTNAQAIKMIVAAMGYNSEAQNRGGWPDGYISTANVHGITNGLYIDSDSFASRADIAVMLYNSTSDESNDINVPDYSQYIGSYFIPESELRPWFGDELKVLDVTNEYIVFDYQNPRSGHQTEFTAETAYFNGTNSANCNGTIAYADNPQETWPASYTITLLPDSIKLQIYTQDSLWKDLTFDLPGM